MPTEEKDERKQQKINENSRLKKNLEIKGIVLAALTLATIITGTLGKTTLTLLHVSVTMTVFSTAAGFLSKHPQSQTVAEGSTASFICELKDCVNCPLHWTAIDTETGLHVSVNPHVVAEDNHLTSTISILAVNNTVVQCEEYNRFATPKRERRHYSKVAVLGVTEEQGRCIAM